MKTKRFRAYRAAHLAEMYTSFAVIMLCFTGNLAAIFLMFIISLGCKAAKKRLRYAL